MKKMDHAIIAPLIRGLCIQASGEPSCVAISDTGQVPDKAFSVDIGNAWKDGQLDEEIAARLLSEACNAWLFDNSPSGTEKNNSNGKTRALPSCIAVTLMDETALYWVDSDYDLVQKRAAEKNAELWHAAGINTANEANSEGRQNVVRNRIALVTGGAQGFGEEIVRGLTSSGALVYIADLNLEGAEKLANELNAAAGRTTAIALASNVSDEASVESMFNEIACKSGGLDLCISNAGVLKAGSVLDMDLSAFNFVTGVNYTGFFIVAKHCGRLLRRQNRTAAEWKTDIIQINSKSGLEGSNKNGAYAGGKFGGIGLVASYALELIEYGIKVNAICPGNFFDGPLWSDPEKGLFVQYLNTGKVPGARSIAEVKAFYEAKVPMKRGCNGTDVMKAIYYIVEQDYETGQAVPVTGGQIMLH